MRKINQLYLLSGVGLKDTVDSAMRAGGVQDEQLRDAMCRYLTQSKSDGTVKKYYFYFKKWLEFCGKNNMKAVPAQPIHIALYLTQLLDKEVNFSVISSTIYSIKWAHNINGKTDPTENGFVSSLLETARRLRSKKVTKKDVVSSEMLKELCSPIVSQACDDLLQVRDVTMILVAYAGFLRYDELSNLKCCNIKFQSEYFSLHIESSKTDQYRSGNEILIAKGESGACPYLMLQKYILLADIDLTSDHFLFKPVYRSGKICKLISKNKPLSYTRTKECLVARLKSVGPSLNLGLHSLRAGGATAAARAGVNERCLKRHGRWRSDISKDGYIEDSLESRLEISRKLKL
ncbi:MAG: tyrosine-type recombinase/integrase [Candidatus Thiodiazotropha taylori]|nr:tyrosine-type recombinase/integrase [Candidatus Thiodiazotropha taylori]MCW4335294.1 tyrosine-type recombinase/integrase [Candidatus Thiodiazotropha endolucinida]